MTYAESHGKAAFDWVGFLGQKEPTQPLCYEAQREAQREAHNWVTCACGAQCRSIPRLSHGAPVDTILAEHGNTFAMQIGEIERAASRMKSYPDGILRGDVDLRKAQSLARTTLARIEERAAEIIFAQHAPP